MDKNFNSCYIGKIKLDDGEILENTYIYRI